MSGIARRLGEKLTYEPPILREYEGTVIRLYPTSMPLPLWAGGLALRRALRNLRIPRPGDFEVKAAKPEKRARRGLLRSPFYPDIPATTDTRKICEILRSKYEVDGREVVEWMIIAAADHVAMTQRMAEYNSVGSEMVGSSGDGNIPGVVVEDIQFRNEWGDRVRAKGYATAVTPRGDFRVSVRQRVWKALGIFKDLISWGSISWLGSIQWTGNLLKWKSLLKTPLDKAIGFFKDHRGQVAPHFVAQIPSRPQLVANVSIVLNTDRSQNVTIRFRDPSDYTSVLYETTVGIDEGAQEISFNISAFPYVPPLVAEIQPEDDTNTVLERYEVS